MKGSEGQQKKMSCRSEVSVWENRLRPWKNFHPPFPVESTPIPFLIGINGSFTMHIYAIMQRQTTMLHKTRAFQGIPLYIMQSGNFFEKNWIFIQNKLSISCGVVFYTCNKEIAIHRKAEHNKSISIAPWKLNSKCFFVLSPLGKLGQVRRKRYPPKR